MAIHDHRPHSEGMGKVIFSQASIHPQLPEGGVYPHLADGEYPHPADCGGGGAPIEPTGQADGWGYPCLADGGYPHPGDRGYPIQLMGECTSGYPPSGLDGVPHWNWMGVPHQDWMGIPPIIRTGWSTNPPSGLDWVPPPPFRTGSGTPSGLDGGRAAEQALATQLAVCLLHSCRRTFLFWVMFMYGTKRMTRDLHPLLSLLQRTFLTWGTV